MHNIIGLHSIVEKFRVSNTLAVRMSLKVERISKTSVVCVTSWFSRFYLFDRTYFDI
jgi:hypothetical protein